MKQIQVQQNRSLKILFKKHYRTNTHDLYKNLNLLNVQNIKHVHTANLVYKHKQSLLPPVFNEYFTWGNDVHSHVSRNLAKLHIRQPLNKNGKQIIQYQGPYIWNKITRNSHKFSECIYFQKKSEEAVS